MTYVRSLWSYFSNKIRAEVHTEYRWVSNTIRIIRLQTSIVLDSSYQPATCSQKSHLRIEFTARFPVPSLAQTLEQFTIPRE